MKKTTLFSIQNLQYSFLALLSFTFLLHTTLSYSPITAVLLHLLSSDHLFLSLSVVVSFIIPFVYYLLTWPHPVLLLNYSCYKPPPHRKCTFQVAESFLRPSTCFSQQSMDFMRNIYLKSGLGDDTYAPPFIFTDDQTPTLKYAMQEAEEGVFSSIDAVLSKSGMSPENIDIVVVTCGGFSPSPSISSLIVNRYRLKPDVKTYNLSGMGCSSGVIAIDLASRILRNGRKIKNALVVITESITLNWYPGDERSMLVTNCIFRVGCAATVLTNDPSYSRTAKMRLVHSLRTHHGADDSAYRAAFQDEDARGITGISLTKDLIRVAGVNLREHIRILAPRILPVRQIGIYAYSVLFSWLSGGQTKAVIPDFTTAFEHICVHTGGKAVIEHVGRVLKLREEVTEPARMSLNRFGNTSSSLVFYELAYFEAKNRVKGGDRMWMIAFGTGFKVGSLVWTWIRDCAQEADNPWKDCVDRYPLKVW